MQLLCRSCRKTVVKFLQKHVLFTPDVLKRNLHNSDINTLCCGMESTKFHLLATI